MTVPEAPAPAPDTEWAHQPVAADEWPAPVTPTAPAARPTSGFGGLAVTPSGPSMYTIAAKEARQATPAADAQNPLGTGTGFGNGFGDRSPDATPEPTLGGLTRRVPGAQRPDAAMASRASEPSAPEPPRSTPEDVYSFLSNFQSGVARGRVDAVHDDDTLEEDGR